MLRKRETLIGVSPFSSQSRRNRREGNANSSNAIRCVSELSTGEQRSYAEIKERERQEKDGASIRVGNLCFSSCESVVCEREKRERERRGRAKRASSDRAAKTKHRGGVI